MRFFPGILSLFVAGSLANHPYEQLVNRDVVIIGGGSAGTYAAIRLMEEGHSVVLVEKEDQLGGHTQTYTDPDTHQPFNLGVAVFHNSTVVRKYFHKLGVKLANPGDDSDSSRAQVYCDFDTGHTLKNFEPVSANASGIAVEKYAKLIGTKYPYLSLGYDLPDPVPKELLEPYSEFIKKNDLQDLVQTVFDVSGYNGNLLDRPALYGIRVFSPLLVEALAKGFVSAASGNNHDLYRRAQRLLKKTDSVILRSKVTKVRRFAENVQVSIETPGQQVLVLAKKLVVAIPPLKKNLQHAGFSLSSEEAELFGKFEGFLYGSAVFEYSGIGTRKDYINVGTKTPYNLPTFPGSYSFKPLVGKKPTNKIVTYYGGLNTSLTEKEIKHVIGDQLQNLGKAGSIGHGKPEFKFFTDHAPYHIHVSAEDVKNGFYKKLYALEGQRSTFWTGAAFVDNDSTLIWTWTEEFLLPRILKSLK
ncbi:hypothetical protein BGZ63DRAFT_386588 [Mariannaea sp. PMI_226]|nr:hypothetical protein BGZ63DRAFT_386588 [Mariannaea sp. PMI_226]